MSDPPAVARPPHQLETNEEHEVARVDDHGRVRKPGTTANPATGHVPREHELKCWPEFYREIESGAKTFELRKDDRGFGYGDVLWLREWRRIGTEPDNGYYTGRSMRRRVTYLLAGFGLARGYVCMALSPELTRVQALRAQGQAAYHDHAYGKSDKLFKQADDLEKAGCHCPALKGEDCPLTGDECNARQDAARTLLRARPDAV